MCFTGRREARGQSAVGRRPFEGGERQSDLVHVHVHVHVLECEPISGRGWLVRAMLRFARLSRTWTWTWGVPKTVILP